MTEELERHASELAERFDEMLVAKVTEGLGEVSESVYGALETELEKCLTESYAEIHEHIEERLEEEVRDLQNLIATLADCLDERTRARFYAKAARDAEQTERPDDDEYPGA